MKFPDDVVTFIVGTEPTPPNFQPLTDLPLVIVVGLTGVGKSTVLELLRQNGLIFILLPNRREITDEIIIASLQAEAGETPYPVKDRVKRFEYTARYRTKYPAGMAYALSQLLIHSNQTRSLLIFDGLRGLSEVQHAREYFLQARFLVLDAPDMVRFNRLLERGDTFDITGITSRHEAPGSQDVAATLQSVPHVDLVFNETQLQQLAAGVKANKIPIDEVLQKISIIVEERRNYDSGLARAYLIQTLPPPKILVIDTAALSARTVARRVTDWLTS